MSGNNVSARSAKLIDGRERKKKNEKQLKTKEEKPSINVQPEASGVLP